MTTISRTSSKKATILGVALVAILLACLPTTVANAQYYYADEYYYDEGYCAYESNVQDAFAAQNPTASSPSQIRGRQNLWGDDGYGDDENLNPSDPLPLGDGWILLVFAAITAGIIFIQQRKHKQQMKQLSTHNAHKILLLLGFFFLAGQSFAWKPIMIGHRGCRMGVENTEVAFLNAIKVYGFQALECDVKMTKDLVPVCWHDDNLSKGPNNYAIASTNLATLQAEKLTQTRNGTTYTGYICTLDRYMEICRDYNVIPVVELKYTTGITSTDMSNFSKIYEVIQKYGMEDRTIILGFESGLKYVRANYPNLRCQHLVNSIDQTKLSNAKTNDWDISSCYYVNATTYVTKALVQQAKDYQRKVSLWTINSASDYAKYAAYGVNYVTSDDLKLKEISNLAGTDPNVSYTTGSAKTIYYRPSTTKFTKGYTNLKKADGTTEWTNVYWTKNSRVSASVHGPYKANIYLDYDATKVNSDLSTSRFIPIAVPDGYTGVITYRLNATTATKANYTTWQYSSAGAGITNSNTVPKFTNSAQIPTPEKIPTDGKNLLCNKEGWWDVWYWAYYLPENNGVTMYFANIDQWENVQLLTGKDIYTTPTNPTTATIPGTKLAYFDLNANEYGYLQYGFLGNGANWDDSKTIPYVGGSESQWVYDETSEHENNWSPEAQASNSNQNRIANRIKCANNRTGLLENLLNGVNLYTPGAANADPLTHHPLASYTDINHTQTFTAETGGKVAASTYKLTGANTTTKLTQAATAGTFSLDAAYTATTTVTATPEVGYTFDGWYLNGTKVSSQLTYTFDAPNKAQTLTARFLLGSKKDVRAQAFLYNSSTDKWEWVDSNDGGTFTMTHSGGTVYTHTTVGYVKNITLSLEEATFQATPNTGYHFIGWWNNPIVYTENPWIMANPADYKQSVTARFAPLYTQTYHTTNGGGMIIVNYNNGQAALGLTNTETTIITSGAIQTLPNEPVSLTATAKPGYKFTGWYEGSTRVSVSAGYQYNATSDKEITARFEEELLAQPGNLRLKYVEQTAISQTLIEEDYFIYSDEIPLSAAGTETVVSMHIYNKIHETPTEQFEGINNPEIILQQYDGSKWVDIEAHMVFGPLQIKNGGSVIKLPGRKNAGDDSNIDDFVYDKGIKAILDDPTDDGCGVWNFIVVQDGTSATIDIDRTHRYTGNYYIRAESADGGYDYYAQKSHLFTYSDYAYHNYGNTHDYSHYFCDNVPAGGNVKFTIACDNNSALAHPLLINNDRFADDEYTTDMYVNNVAGEPVLPAMASVRYSWDIVTNRLTRAYIAESKPKLGNEYLVIDGASLASTEANYPYFYDNTNWVYSIDVDYKLDAKAQVKAKYNGKYQYFWGNESIGLAFVHSDGSDNTSLTYPVRIVYDFKEHRFTTIYKPTDVISGTIDLAIPVMILREHNDPATQIVFNSNADKVTAKGDGKYAYSYPAYGVLTFLEDKFATDATTTNHYEKMFYWVSFPFDVNIDDVVGLGEYEGYWAVQYYNGPKRALQGLPDGTTGWEYVQKGETLKANVGYVVCLNYRRLTKDYGFEAGQGRKLSLYFPSASPVSPTDVKNQANITVTLEEHPRGEKVAWNHWNWHLLGVPSYANPGFRTTQGAVPFFYQYWHPTDGYAAVASTEVDFYAMHSYMVQYAGEIEWSKIVNTAPSGLAAKKNADNDQPVNLRLELQQAGNTIDKTYVQLRDEEGTEGFDLNLDLTKIINKGANIYTVVNGDQMAGNVVPAQESMIPLGVVITEAGEYTLTLPSNTNGVTVELVDYTTGLKLTKIEAKFWRVYQYGNICSATIFWELYKGDTKIANNSEDCTSWGNWSGNNCTLSKTLNLDFLAKTTGPGAYTIKVYGKLTGRSQDSKYDDPSYLGCDDNFWYNNNNTGSYSITFTIDPVVTFKANGGTGSDYTQTVKYNTATALTANKFTRTGYSFNGWKTAANSGTSYANQASVKFTANTTLYAQWTPAKYTITYKDQNNANFSGSHDSGYPTKHTYGTATNLKTATKTGYTFGGWHTDQACTQKVTSLGATAYTAAITLYAKWTINQYTLTYSAGEGGSVTGDKASGAKYDYNTSITLTATPTTGNVLAQWVNENGTTVSTDNPYTFNLTANKTVKAEFAPPTTVYLKPVDFWPADNARFAIYTWGVGKTDRWVEMQHVDCENQYYSANIPSGYTNFKYIRLNPAGKGNASKNDGLHFDYRWNETGELTVKEDILYTTPRIYLKPNSNWTQANARFAAYFFEDGKEAQWMSMYKDGDYYYCNMVEGYSKVIFCRMNPANETNDFNNCWNKSADQTIAGNCFTVTEGEWGENPNDQNYNEAGATGTWSEHYTTFSTPTYSVTIKPTIHGTYSVVCNGRTYLAPNKEEIVIPNVPVGTTLTIQDVIPNNETEYTSDIIYKESANAEYQKLEEGNPITVCGNTTIGENFVTKNAHVVYFRVPTTSLATSWNANGSTNFVYSYNDIKKGATGYVTEMAEDNSIQDAQYTYYCCTIPADCHTFRFERKNNANESAQQKTVSFTHAMPFNGMNCFTITNKSGEEYTGYWDVLLTNGDYRLLYVEQVVEKSTNSGDEWKTVVTRKKAHPSDIIKKGTPSQIVSLHIYKERTYMANAGGSEYESSNNPEIILQQYNSSTNTWENKERHMVFGPLQTLPGMAMAPGRRNAVANAELVYDDGIEIIKKDDHADAGSGVWNFTVTQSNGGESATIDLTQTRRYNEETDGPYYIRTDVANGNWYNYTNPDNHMTRSDVSKQHSNYSHYFCKWVKSTGNVNVKFTIANKYGYAISDTLEADRTDLWGVELTEAQKMLKDQTLPENANVRFTWNEKSNLIHRAYIAGSADVQDRFLVLRGKGDSKLFNAAGEALTEGQAQTSRYGLHANEEIFSDIENWVYQTDVQMIPGAELQVTADYHEKVQYFVGKEGIFNNTILQGSSNEKYLVRLLYDFKTNELISAYVPGASKDVDQISTNLMIIRQNYGEAKQLVFNNGDMSTRENRRAYGVIEFTENYLKDGSIPYLKRCLYWVSFPFDVNLSEAFGSLVYGKHWLIQEYDGARRAAEGLWKESESFWKLHWEPNITLEAGLGYVIEIDINQMIKDNIINTTDGKQQIAALYFPSNTPITREIINQVSYTVNIPAHKCEIVHTGTYGDRTIRDSHWNVIGVPSYINTGATFSDPTYALNNVVKYYYRWDGEVDKYTAMEATNHAYNFHSMYAYMVQYAGDITWNSVLLDVEPAQIAAKKNSVTNEHAMRLELQQNNILLDKTFVRLQDDVATHAFDFNYDLCKITNKGANIYSIITEEASPVEVAANVLPIKETIIPIGIKTDASGEYTFAMPDGTDGIVVELIDYENNTRTNMLLDNYTVNLGKGTFDNRFALHVKPDKTTTSVDNIGNEATGDKVKKYLIDGILYMQKDGVLYDAQGKLVR